jgi:hypothetical protein
MCQKVNFTHHSVYTRSFGIYRFIAQMGILLCKSNDGMQVRLPNAPESCSSDSQEHDTVYVMTLENVVQYQHGNYR